MMNTPMKTQHTLGPWQYEETHQDPDYAGDEGAMTQHIWMGEAISSKRAYKVLHHIKIYEDFDELCPEIEEARANARLIAAAPQMFAELKAIGHHIQVDTGHFNRIQMLLENIEQPSRDSGDANG